MEISEIKIKLKDLNISQSKMAKALSVSKDYVNQILNERRECSQRMKTKMIVFIKKNERERKK